MRRTKLLYPAVISCALGCQTLAPGPAPEVTPPPMPSGPGRTVNITIRDYMYSPSEIVARPGDKLHLVVSNGGQNEHSIEFDFPARYVPLPSHLKPAETEQYDIVVPDQPGKYYF